MKHLLTIIILSSCININAQKKENFNDYFKKNYSRLDLEYFIFYEAELINCMADTSFRKNFTRDVKNQVRKIQTFSSVESSERKILLNVLYRRINAMIVQNKELTDSKSFLLNQLSEFKELDFAVDFNLLEKRLDPKKRGMPFGDEECSYDFSLFIFFVHDPELYVRVITDSPIIGSADKKILFPIKCFYEELSPLSLEVKKRTQRETLEILKKYRGSKYDSIRNMILNADLNAKFN